VFYFLSIGENGKFVNVDPSVDQLNAMNNLAEARTWLNMSDVTWSALERTLTADSGQRVTRFGEITLIPAAIWDQHIGSMWVETDPGAPGTPLTGTGYVAPTGRWPSALEWGQVGGLRRISRLRIGLSAADDPPAAQGPPPGGGACQGGGAGPGVPGVQITSDQTKVKISEVVDQADHTEVVAWGPTRHEDTMTVFRTGNGDLECPPHREPTPLQFAGLEYKLKVVGSAWVDAGVFRPYGGRLQRTMKMTVQVWGADGKQHPVEIAGPADVEAWTESWEVLAVAMRAMQEATRERLELYRDMIQHLAKLWPECWDIVARGDMRMRTERMVRHLRWEKAAKAQAEADGKRHPLNVAKPFDYLF